MVIYAYFQDICMHKFLNIRHVIQRGAMQSEELCPQKERFGARVNTVVKSIHILIDIRKQIKMEDFIKINKF